MIKEKIGGDIVESNWYESTKLFEHMDLEDELLRGIYWCGFTTPSIIQQKLLSQLF